MNPAVTSRVRLLLGFGAVLTVILIALLIPLLPTFIFSSAKQERAEAIRKAQDVYQQKKTENISFDDSPCIAENLMADWVADVAHNPRQDIDNQPENQCQSYRDGEAHHFVELDPDGNIIRTQ